MVYLLKLALFATATRALSPLVLDPRATQPVLTDLHHADSDTKTVTKYVNAFTLGVHGLPGPTAQTYIDALDSDLANCTADARKSGPIYYSQFVPICTYVAGPLYNDTDSMLQAFVAKQPKLTAAGLRGAVLSDLQQLRNQTVTCLTSIQVRGPIPQGSGTEIASPCSTVGANYQKIYASAIAAFN